MEATFRSKVTSFLGATLLASGTSIGAGMLALPVLTGLAGFVPALILYVISWIVMTYTSFLILEVVLWMDKEANIISMAQNTLGGFFKIVAFATYLFLFYSVSVAYLSGSGSIIVDMIDSIFGINLPKWIGVVISLMIFGPSVYFGTKTVANTNFILIVGIAVGYILLIIAGKSFVHNEMLVRSNWLYSLMGIPVIVTSFTFQNIIPSITTYLKGNLKMLKGAILLGGLFPLIIYVVWEWFVLGIVPEYGSNSLRSALAQGEPATHSLKILLHNPLITTFSEIFAFCAIVTSFLGVILSLFDFMADGFKIEKKGNGKLLLCALIFVPPLIFAVSYPRAFLTALNYAGSIGCVILFIILPALMVNRGRYHLNMQGPFRTWGGRPILYLLVLLGVCILFLQLCLSMGWVPSS